MTGRALFCSAVNALVNGPLRNVLCSVRSARPARRAPPPGTMAPPVQLRCLVTGVRVNQALRYFLTLQVRARPPAVPTR